MHNPKHVQSIDQLITDLSPDELNRLIHERKRGRKHTIAKSTQPSISLSISDDHWASIVADFTRPIDDSEREDQELDYLCQIAKGCLVSGSREDALFAAFRVVRWCWAHHGPLGPIEA